MIRVAHVDHTSDVGGAELALARLVLSTRWIPRIFVPPSTRRIDAFSSLPDEMVVHLGVAQPPGATEAGRALSLIALAARAAYQAIALRVHPEFRRADVVHANSSRSALIAWAATVGSSRRLVVHLRDEVAASAIGAAAHRLLTFVLHRASGVVANSQYTMDSAAPHIREGCHAAVIASSIGLAAPRARPVTRPAVGVIGMLARLSPWKGQQLLIKAFAQAFRGSTTVLELAGSPAFGEQDFLGELQQLAVDLGVESQVKFLGHVEDVWALLDSWDICVQASLRPEPLGQNVLQYLAACRPVIVANAGGPLEWVSDARTGLLFRSGDSEDLAAKLGRLAHDFELRERLSANLAMTRPVLLDDEVADRYARFFSAVAKSASR